MLKRHQIHELIALVIVVCYFYAIIYFPPLIQNITCSTTRDPVNCNATVGWYVNKGMGFSIVISITALGGFLWFKEREFY